LIERTQTEHVPQSEVHELRAVSTQQPSRVSTSSSVGLFAGADRGPYCEGTVLPTVVSVSAASRLSSSCAAVSIRTPVLEIGESLQHGDPPVLAWVIPSFT